jgi:opacity protein-like surface antigen
MRQRTRTPRCRLLALAAALVLAAPAAWAQDAYTDEDFQKPGLYLSGLAAYAFPMEKGDLEDEANALYDLSGFGPGTRTDVDDSLGLSAHAGYRLHPRFAVEAQFDWLSNIQLDSDLGTGGRAKSDITLYSLTANAKTYLLTGRFQPWLAAGAGWGQSRLDPTGAATNERDDGFVMRMGGGIDVYGNPDVALTIDTHYVLATGGMEDLDYVSIGAGLMLRFYGGD